MTAETREQAVAALVAERYGPGRLPPAPRGCALCGGATVRLASTGIGRELVCASAIGCARRQKRRAP